MKQLTRNFAKRQLTWFRSDKRIRWTAAANDLDHLANEALNKMTLRHSL